VVQLEKPQVQAEVEKAQSDVSAEVHVSPNLLVEIHEETQIPVVKVSGKEIPARVFDILNQRFREQNANLYEGKNETVSPEQFIFIEPEREQSNIEKRLEDFFRAHVIKYTDGEWGRLKEKLA